MLRLPQPIGDQRPCLLGSVAHALLESYLRETLRTGGRPPLARVAAIAAGFLEQDGVPGAGSDVIREAAALVTRWLVLQKDSRPDIHPLSFEEKARFLEALPPRWRPYFEVAFGTGLRPSEQIGLKQEHIDWDRNVLEIREGWRAGQRTRLKTAAANREVDILPAVRIALEEQRRIAGASELVFPNRFGSPINLHNLRARVWYPTLAKASLRRRDLYNTRHTFATYALASGEDPGWVAKMLGHTTLTS